MAGTDHHGAHPGVLPGILAHPHPSENALLATHRRPVARLALGLVLALLLAPRSDPARAEPLPVAIDKALRLQQIDQADLSLYLREVTADRPRLAVNAPDRKSVV